MRFALRYQTEYRYSGPVFDQHNSLRVKPANGELQRVRHFRVAVDPTARTRSYRDYFGTEVIDFNVPGEHEPVIGVRRDLRDGPAVVARSDVQVAHGEQARERLIHRPLFANSL